MVKTTSSRDRHLLGVRKDYSLDTSKLDINPLFIDSLDVFCKSESRGFYSNSLNCYLSSHITEFNYNECYNSLLNSKMSDAFSIKNNKVPIDDTVFGLGGRYDNLVAGFDRAPEGQLSFNVKNSPISILSGSCIDFANKKILMLVGVKDEFKEYAYLKRNVGLDVDPFALKILIDSEFYENKSKDYSLNFLKFVKEVMNIFNGVEIEFVDGLDLFRDTIHKNIPFEKVRSLNSISKRNEYADTAQHEFMEYCLASDRLKEAKIIIS